LKYHGHLRAFARIAVIIIFSIFAPAGLAGQTQTAPQGGVDEPLKKGDELFKAGKYQEAIAAYKLVLEREPNNDQAIGYIAYSFNKLGDRAQARQWMKRRVEIPGQVPATKAMILNDIALLCWDEAHLAIQSKIYSGSGQIKPDEVAGARNLLAEGIESAQKATTIAPRSVKAFNLLNMLYRTSAESENEPSKQKELIAKADEALRQSIKFFEALTIPPTDMFAIPMMITSSRIDAGQSLALGQPTKAVPLLSSDPNDKTMSAVEVFVGSDGKIRLQRLVAGQGKSGSAALAVTRQWEFQPSTFEGHAVQVVQVLTFGGSGNSAANRMGATGDVQPAPGREVLEGKVVDHIERGDELARTRRYDEAIAEYKAALAEAGKPVFTAYLNMGGVYFQKADYRAASEAYRQATSARPQEVTGYYNLAESLYALGDYREAETAYRKVIELSPGRVNARAHHFLGLALYNQKRLEEAIPEYRLAIDQARGGSYAEARYNLGIALLERGDLQAAEREFRLAIQQEKRDWAEAHFNLATTLERMRRFNEAADEYEAYLSRSPAAENAASLRKHIAELRKQK